MSQDTSLVEKPGVPLHAGAGAGRAMQPEAGQAQRSQMLLNKLVFGI